jgi:hypothetical protein
MATASARRPVYSAPNPYDHGNHRIPPGMLQVQSGTPDPVDLLAHRRTVLHRQSDGRLVRERWTSAANGQVLFDRIPAGVYYIIGFDHTGVFNGACTTHVPSELMPDGGLLSPVGVGP